VAHRHQGDCKLQIAPSKPLLDRSLFRGDKGDVGCGKMPVKCGQHLGHQSLTDGGGSSDPQPSAALSGLLSYEALCLFKTLEDVMGSLPKNLAGRRETDYFVGADQEFGPDLTLQQSNLLTDSGLCKSQILGGRCKAPFVGKCQESFQELNVEFHIWLRFRSLGGCDCSSAMRLSIATAPARLEGTSSLRKGPHVRS